MTEARIFLSYRRQCDSSRAGLLHIMIDSTFNRTGQPPKLAIFRDTRSRPGAEWPDEVRAALTSADIVLVVIGPEWLGAKDKHERRRIDKPDDWVRQEIQLALTSEKEVIPVVFDHDPPPSEALPESIRDLSTKQGVVVRDEFWDNDLQPLLAEIEQHVGGGPTRVEVPGRSGELPYPNPPLKVPPAPMADADIQRTLSEMLDGWEIVEGPLPEDPNSQRVELHRDFTLQSFRDVLTFMSDVGDFCDKANHHPRWENVYRTLRVYLTTWDIGHRVSHLDVMVAHHFDNAYAAYLAAVGKSEK